jgi:hypothetical protein
MADFSADVDIDYGTPEITVGPWHFDPVDQVWTAKTGPHRWAIVESDVNDPPTFSPYDV